MNYLDEFEVSFSEHQTIEAVANTYYSTTREEVVKEHTDEDWTNHIYRLYEDLMKAYPGKVKRNDFVVDNFTNYEYVISTGEYTTNGHIQENFGADDIKKPKYLILSGIHGNERNAALSVYRFIRDVINGHNVPQSFKEGVTISVMPVGNPNGFNKFVTENAEAVNLNQDFNRETKAKETQAIINWLKANEDADLFIDAHNGGQVNEIVAICGDSSQDAVKTAKRVAMRGVDRIIPFWKNVIGYPSEVESVSWTFNPATQKFEGIGVVKPVIFSYCANLDKEIYGGMAHIYASRELGIPSIAAELSVYYGNYSDYNPDFILPPPNETYPPETIAAGAEVIGNILIEIYNQALWHDVGNIDSALDGIIALQNKRIGGGAV